MSLVTTLQLRAVVRIKGHRGQPVPPRNYCQCQRRGLDLHSQASTRGDQRAPPRTWLLQYYCHHHLDFALKMMMISLWEHSGQDDSGAWNWSRIAFVSSPQELLRLCCCCDHRYCCLLAAAHCQYHLPRRIVRLCGTWTSGCCRKTTCPAASTRSCTFSATNWSSSSSRLVNCKARRRGIALMYTTTTTTTTATHEDWWSYRIS